VEPVSARLPVLGALRQRDFRLLFGGQTISQIGDAAFVVALGWRAFTLTRQAASGPSAAGCSSRRSAGSSR
jgi:hypothetical protein